MKSLISITPHLPFVPLPGGRHWPLTIPLSAVILVAGALVGEGKIWLSFSGWRARHSTQLETQKRLIFLRHDDTREGSRCLVTSDSLLDDYSSYVEGERFLVRLPQSTLFNGYHTKSGRGFADMRVEEGEEDVVISFILQPGASVSLNQSFNRLEINFLTNEEAKESQRKIAQPHR